MKSSTKGIIITCKLENYCEVNYEYFLKYLINFAFKIVLPEGIMFFVVMYFFMFLCIFVIPNRIKIFELLILILL